MNAVNITFRVIGSVLVPVAVAILLYLLEHKSKYFKKMPFLFRECLIGIAFGGLSIVGFYLGVKIPYTTTTGMVDYVTFGTTALAPYLAGILFSYPAAIVSTIIGATFRALQPDQINFAVMAAIIFSGAIGIFARYVVFGGKKGRWYYAALGIVLIECLNNIFIFIIAKGTMREAYDIVKYSDIVCIATEALAVILSIILTNLLDGQRKKKVKKMHISSKIQIGVSISSLVILFLLIGSSFVIVQSRSESDAKSDLAISTTGIVDDAEELDKSGRGDIDTAYMDLARHRNIQTTGFSIIVLLRDQPVSGGYIKANTIISCRDNKWTEVGGIIPNPFVYQKVNFAANNGKNIFDFVQYAFTNPNDATMFPISFDNSTDKKDYYGTFMYCKDGFHGVMSLVTTDEVNYNAAISTRTIIYGEVAAFIALFAIINVCVDRIVVDKIHHVNDSLERIIDGNLDETVNIKDSAEFETLSEDINLTVGSLKNYASEIESRIESELLLARNIQNSSVPHLFPVVKDFDIYAMMHTAKEVGGDFYDFLTMTDHRLLFLIADVSGKGISAAMFMMRAKTYIKSLASTGISLAEIARRTNNELCQENDAGFFVTAWFGILNTENGELEYVNCGHCSPLLRINNEYRYLEAKPNFVLAGLENMEYHSEKIKLNPGDFILLYTDGVTEATNPKNELYAEKRLLDCVKQEKYFTSRQICDFILDSVNKFASGAPQADDITILTVRYLGEKGEISDSHNEVKLSPNVDNVAIAVNFAKAAIIKHAGSSKVQSETAVIVDEIFSYLVDKAKEHSINEISVRLSFNFNTFSLVIAYDGDPFDIFASIDANKQISEDNLGLLIVKKTVEKITYRRHNNQNIFFIEKKL